MAFDERKLKEWSEEDAYDFAVDCLRRFLQGRLQLAISGSPFDIRATDLINEFLSRERITEPNDKINATAVVGGKLMSAMWLLCLRGVLRPSVARIGNWDRAADPIAGNGYSFTEQGRKWLLEDPHSILLVASQSYAKIVSQYGAFFGDNFVERAVDAIRCYDCGAYLACCAMCGAACESIYLALAISKSADEKETLKMYRASDGRKRLKNSIEYGKSGGLLRALVHRFQSNVQDDRYTLAAMSKASSGVPVGRPERKTLGSYLFEE